MYKRGSSFAFVTHGYVAHAADRRKQAFGLVIRCWETSGCDAVDMGSLIGGSAVQIFTAVIPH